jgi:cardiolipin synthase A/B
MDWNASAVKEEELISFDEKLFPDLDENDISKGDMAVQVVSDGPDNDEPYMRNGLVRLMMLARKRVWIQTPYLIPDEAMIAARQILASSGVDLRIMIPCMPDHPFIYRATQWYANQLVKIGVKVYTYNNGFMHATTIIVDDKYANVGRVNQDYRSYYLNFEDNVFVYDRAFNKEMSDQFEKDMEQSTLLTPEMIKKQSCWLRFLQNFSRLLSPIL